MAEGNAGLVRALGGSALMGVLALFYWAVNRCRGTNWRPVGTVTDIHLYPLKSGPPLGLATAFCSEKGLKHSNMRDRMFVAYDEFTGSVITSKTDPKLLKINVQLGSKVGVFRFTGPSGSEPLEVDLSNLPEDTKSIRMKFPTTETEVLRTIDCGDPASSWISSELSRPGVRLGYWPEDFHRDICKPRFRELSVFTKISNEIAGAYSNMSSYLLVNRSSVEDLVGRLRPNSSVGPDNFRANLLVSGAEPYAEDGWQKLKIGDAVFSIVKPCVRCTLVTVDPRTLKRDPDMEPLKTLKTYRQLSDAKERNIEGDSPVMGCYMGLDTPGQIAVGNIVYGLGSEPKMNISKMFRYLL